MLQTQDWTSGRAQPVDSCGMQQEVLPGHVPQSAAQELQFSPMPASHTPSPQHDPQSCGHDEQVSPSWPSQFPLPQQLPQSWGHVEQLSSTAHAPSPHTAPPQPPQP